MDNFYDLSEFNLIGLVRRVDIEFSNLEVTDGKMIEKYKTYEYLCFDRHGHLLEEVSRDRELVDQVYRDVYIRDEHGNLLEQEEYSRDGQLLGKKLFVFTENGNHIERHFYVHPEKRELVLGCVTKYDRDNNFIEIVSYSVEGKITSQTESQDFPRQLEKSTVTQTDDGSIIEENSFDVNGNLEVKCVRKLDKCGNELESKRYDPDGTMWQHWENKYDFDETGNWIRCLQSYWVIGWGPHNLFPFTKTIRAISYYT